MANARTRYPSRRVREEFDRDLPELVTKAQMLYDEIDGNDSAELMNEVAHLYEIVTRTTTSNYIIIELAMGVIDSLTVGRLRDKWKRGGLSAGHFNTRWAAISYLDELRLKYHALAKDDADPFVPGGDEYAGISFSSEDWTGRPTLKKLSVESTDQLRSEIIILQAKIEALPLSNESKQQALGYVVALKTLSDMPEPPLEIMWTMIERLSHVLAFPALLVSIVALMKA